MSARNAGESKDILNSNQVSCLDLKRSLLISKISIPLASSFPGFQAFSATGQNHQHHRHNCCGEQLPLATQHADAGLPVRLAPEGLWLPKFLVRSMAPELTRRLCIQCIPAFAS